MVVRRDELNVPKQGFDLVDSIDEVRTLLKVLTSKHCSDGTALIADANLPSSDLPNATSPHSIP
jgi:hypothetical protein